MTRHLPIFAYGILRKRSFIQQLRQIFDVDEIECVPAVTTGWIPYHSNGINLVIPVPEKTKEKKKDATFPLKGTLLYFKADEDTLDAIYSYIDGLESGYHRTRITTATGAEAWLYFVDNDFFTYINTFGRGLVIYPDSILDKCKYTGKFATPTTNGNLVTYNHRLDYIG